MRAIILLLATLIFYPCFAQQPIEMAAKVSVSADDIPLSGDMEITAAYAKDGDEVGMEIFKRSITSISVGQTMQLSVAASYKDGTAEKLTQNARVDYEVDGCLQVSKTGLLLATPVKTCHNPKTSTLTVIVNDRNGEVMGWNTYIFSVN